MSKAPPKIILYIAKIVNVDFSKNFIMTAIDSHPEINEKTIATNTS